MKSFAPSFFQVRNAFYLGLLLFCMACSQDYKTAATLEKNGYWEVIKAFEEKFPSVNRGGSIVKKELQYLLNNTKNKNGLISFRFYKEPQFGQLGILIRGTNLTPQEDSKACHLKTGFTHHSGRADSQYIFVEPTIEWINENTFKLLVNTYQQDHFGKTLGGSIDVAALVEIIESTPSKSETINFSFGFDPSSENIFLIFEGGNYGKNDGTILRLRNGPNPKAYCPNNCEDGAL